MNERQYLIEVLLRARESISQVAAKAVRALDDVTKAQQRNTAESNRASAPLREQISTLEQLVAAHTREKKALEDSARSLRSTATARRQAANTARQQLEELQKQARIERATATEREKRDIEEVRRMRLEVAERVASSDKKTKAYNRETKEMRQQIALLHALNQESAAANQRRAAELGVQIAQIQQGVRERTRAATLAEQAAGREETAYSRVSSSVDKHNRALGRAREALSKLEGSTDNADRSTGRFTRTLTRMGVSTTSARSGLRGLNAEFQGFQIALMIKYAQSLISVLVALGAQLVAVAAAAGQAAIGIGAALASGAAQAVPVVGLLVAAFARLTTILKAVKLQNQQQLTATHDAARAAKAQQTATDQIRQAEQRVADAHRNTAQAVRDLARTRSDAAREETQAQQEVNRARREAIRTVEDLMAAEEDARRALDDARASRTRAIETGDVAGAIQADVDISRARVGVRRAGEDVARARGGEGIDAVQSAEQRLADTRRSGARQIQQAEQHLGDARRDERRATDDLSRTRRQSADNVEQETAAVDKLADSLKQLSPAERDLYRRILVLQDTYKRIARPITDIITRAFTDVVNRVNSLLGDPRIARGFRNIATQVAESIRQVSGEAGGERSVGFFQILSAEATRNIPIATRILINFFDAVRNLIIDAAPAFRLLLGYIEDYSERAKDASGNSKGITEFFKTGVRYAKAFFDLGLAVINLFLALAGRGGAAHAGLRTVRDLTGAVDDLTERVRHNSGRIRRFFDQTHDAFFDVLGVVGKLASTILESFSLRSVRTFADFLNRVIIPALGNVIQIMGVMVSAFHAVFSLPGIADVAQMAATILILARGLTVIRSAIGSIMGIIPAFLRSMGLMVAAEEGAAAGFALTPMGAFVVGLGLVIAAIVLLDKKLHFLAPTWRFIKRVAMDVWDAIKSGGESVIRWFSDVWTQGLLYWIRWPFVWLARHVGGPAFNWIKDAARDIIDWLHRTFGPGGDFAVIGELILLPFRTARAGIKLILSVIGTIIGGALDLIAGRFDDFGDRISDFWAGFLDVGRGAISSLLGIVGDLLGALGKIPKIGGPFKDAAKDVREAQHNIDDLRDSTKKHREEQKRSDDVVKDSLPTLVLLRRRYEVAKDRLDKLTPGTKDYREAVKTARERSKDYNDELKHTADRAGNARQPVSKLRSNIQNLGGVSADTADVIAKNLNDVLRQVGARTIRLNTRAYRKSGIDQMTEVTGHAATGGVLGNGRLRRRLWGGGVPNPYGGAADDHVLLSPSGAPVAALSGSEGIVNTPQMGVINQALDFTKQMTGMPWGSLNDLWGSGMRHYQTGGGLKPAIRNLSNRLDRMFGLQTTSTTGDTHAPGSYHYRGLAADVSGTTEAMARAVRYIKTSGITRSLLEGIHNPGLSIKNGQAVSPGFWGASTWGDHLDHIHLAVQSLSARLSAALGGAGRVRSPRITGLGSDALSGIARGSARLLTRAANRYLDRQMTRLGGGDTNFRMLGRGVSGSNQKMGRQMMLRAGWSADQWPALKTLWTGESNWDETARNNSSGATGIPQALPASKMGPGAVGRGAAVAKRQIAWGLGYIKDRYRSPSRALAAWQSRSPHWYQTGGSLRGTAGPTTGGLRQPGGRGFPNLADLIARRMRPVLDVITGLFSSVTTALEATARGPLRRSKNLAQRIARAFTRITGDGGLLDQMGTQIEAITTRSALALQRRQFRVTRQGPQRRFLSDAQVAQGELQGLQGQRTGLTDQRDAINDSIEAAQRSLRVARRRHNRRAADAARAALVNLRARLQTNSEALAQNAQDQVEAQETFQQALLSAVNDAADRRNSAIDRFTRLAKALGRTVDPNALAAAQVSNLRQQIGGLQGVLAQARRTGNRALANQVSDQIDELNVQIAEAVAQQFQSSIDAVNNAAARQSAQLDRATRRAQIGGQTNFAAMQNILGARTGVLTNQRSGLLGLLAQAQAQGNTEQVDNLVDQIDELNTQILENTQAIQDNTDAAFNFTTQLINERAGFQQGVFGSAQSFFQALTESTGIDTLPQQLAALQGIATSLQTQGQGLAGQLAALIGNNTATTLTGTDLVNYLVSISSGPAFDAIMAGLDPTQRTAFQDLVNALLSNATATVQNTTAINGLTNPGAQSFASTLWSTFRSAVFTGAGGLLPQYQMAVPTAAVGAKVLSSGMLVVHAGERVYPASVSRDYGSVPGGDTYHLNLTTPTQVLDPTDVGRQLAFYRKQGRR